MDTHFDNKIKTFRFTVSNAASMNLKQDQNDSNFQKLAKEITSQETIDNTINDFLADKLLVDVKINTIDVNYHNNARGNKIDVIYTVIYRESKPHMTVKQETTI